MDEIITVIQCVLVLGLFMAGGFASVKTGYISGDAASSVSKIVTRLMFPTWLAAKLLSEDISKQQIISQLPLFAAGAVITFVLLLLGVLLAKITKTTETGLRCIPFFFFSPDIFSPPAARSETVRVHETRSEPSARIVQLKEPSSPKSP